MTANVNSGSTYLITNVKAGTAMDSSAGDNTTGWPVNGDHGSANQHWAMSWTGSAWTFQNVWTGKFLTAVGTNDGANITATDTPFGWDIWRDENDPNTFRIFVPNTHENLDLWGNGLATPGNPITLWWTWNGLHQTWNFTEAFASARLKGLDPDSDCVVGDEATRTIGQGSINVFFSSFSLTV